MARSLFEPIADDLGVLDQAIDEVAAVDHPLLGQTLRLTLSGSGKRLRPALALMAARLHPNDQRRRVELAMAAELLHTATLVHDDVIDLSAARRGRETINTAFGNTLAVLTGDFLFGKSGELVAGLGSPAIMGVFSWAVMELVKGEMLRPTLDGDLDSTEREYLAKIRGKTASLFAMCCQTGAMLDSDEPEIALRLRDYGASLGMAFQIVDDVLDYTATEEQLGKPVGSDLRQGTITLPALAFLRDHGGHAAADVIRGLVAHDDEFQPRTEEAVEAVRRSSAVDAALALAETYVADAQMHLAGLPANPIVESLYRLARYVIERRG
jgi:geranylgeranyl pyrophosphate synthase